METFVKLKKQLFVYRWIDLLGAQLCSVHCRKVFVFMNPLKTMNLHSLS